MGCQGLNQLNHMQGKHTTCYATAPTVVTDYFLTIVHNGKDAVKFYSTLIFISGSLASKWTLGNSGL